MSVLLCIFQKCSLFFYSTSLHLQNFTGNRVVIAYRNGLIILWGLHETQVLAVLGGTKRQRDTLAEYAASLHESSSFSEKSAEAQASSLSEQFHFPPPKSPTTTTTTWPEIEDDEKEICSVCWACGNIFVAGYVDGDIQFWSFPNENKIQGQQQPESPRPSSASGVVPLRKIDLAPGKTARMPVMVLRWWDSAKSSGKHGGGQLYVYGGGEVGAPEVLRVGSSLSHTTFLQNSFHNSFTVYIHMGWIFA
jgi:syntaxin-binding protein 5